MNPAALKPRRIVLLMHNWVGYLHGVQLGISQYLLQRPDWIWTRMLPVPELVEQLVPQRPDGMIAYVEKEQIPLLRRLRIPIVDLSNWFAKSPFPRVLPDDVATGRLAARYLLELGLKRFAVVGPPEAAFAMARERGFAAALREESFECMRFTDETRTQKSMIAWLQQLPQPTGLFAAHDNVAAEVLEACRHGAVPVPEHLCILGVDNDELVSKFTHPPLSSIELPLEKIGFEAARLLDQLMSGGTGPEAPVLFPPVGVVARQSTNLLLVPEEDVLMAVRHIREHVHEQVTVKDLLDVVPVNRRYLERKFKKHVGRTPLQEIRRTRIEKAKDLLATTDLSMPAIARRSGFPNPERLANVFHQEVGLSPTGYRKQYRQE